MILFGRTIITLRKYGYGLEVHVTLNGQIANLLTILVGLHLPHIHGGLPNNNIQIMIQGQTFLTVCIMVPLVLIIFG